MNKSNIQIEVCRTAPAIELQEGRTVLVGMTQNGHLHMPGIDTLSRVECETLAKVLASFAKHGDLSEFK